MSVVDFILYECTSVRVYECTSERILLLQR